MIGEQSELPSSASDSDDTLLQEEHDDFGNLFDEIETPLLSDGNFESRTKFIELQRSDQSLDELFTSAKMGQSDNNTASYSAMRNYVLVRCNRDRVMHVGLETTRVVVPKQLQNKLLTVVHEYPISGHLRVKKTIDRLTRHFYWVGVGKPLFYKLLKTDL